VVQKVIDRFVPVIASAASFIAKVSNILSPSESRMSSLRHEGTPEIPESKVVTSPDVAQAKESGTPKTFTEGE
jgi:hypothetical protein